MILGRPRFQLFFPLRNRKRHLNRMKVAVGCGVWHLGDGDFFLGGNLFVFRGAFMLFFVAIFVRVFFKKNENFCWCEKWTTWCWWCCSWMYTPSPQDAIAGALHSPNKLLRKGPFFWKGKCHPEVWQKSLWKATVTQVGKAFSSSSHIIFEGFFAVKIQGVKAFRSHAFSWNVWRWFFFKDRTMVNHHEKHHHLGDNQDIKVLGHLKTRLFTIKKPLKMWVFGVPW